METEYATPLGWAAVGSRYCPDHPGDNSRLPTPITSASQRLVAAGARIELKFVEMSVGPLADWLAQHIGGRHI